MTDAISNIQLSLTGMTCSACARLVTRRLTPIEGVSEVKVDVKNGSVVITSTRPVGKDEIVKALAGTEYQVIGTS